MPAAVVVDSASVTITNPVHFPHPSAAPSMTAYCYTAWLLSNHGTACRLWKASFGRTVAFVYLLLILLFSASRVPCQDHGRVDLNHPRNLTAVDSPSGAYHPTQAALNQLAGLVAHAHPTVQPADYVLCKDTYEGCRQYQRWAPQALSCLQ
jgi:hypothetical protein